MSWRDTVEAVDGGGGGGVLVEDMGETVARGSLCVLRWPGEVSVYS